MSTFFSTNTRYKGGVGRQEEDLDFHLALSVIVRRIHNLLKQ